MEHPLAMVVRNIFLGAGAGLPTLPRLETIDCLLEAAWRPAPRAGIFCAMVVRNISRVLLADRASARWLSQHLLTSRGADLQRSPPESAARTLSDGVQVAE